MRSLCTVYGHVSIYFSLPVMCSMLWSNSEQVWIFMTDFHRLQNQTGLQIYSLHFMEPESSLPYSQAPATCPYPEPTPSSPHNPFPLPEDPS